MAQIGKNPLPEQTKTYIEEQFASFVRGSHTPVLIELLTEVELLMLAKRLAALFMLIDEQSYYRIEQTLGMSVSTSRRLHQLLISGEYRSIERIATSKRERERVLGTIGKILRGGLPPRAYVIKKRKK